MFVGLSWFRFGSNEVAFKLNVMLVESSIQPTPNKWILILIHAQI